LDWTLLETVILLNELEKPSVRDAFDISFPVTWQKCVLDIRKVDWERPEQLQARINYLKNHAARNIKRFSNSRGKAAIVQYMEANFVPENECTFRLPIFILDLISNGILHFRQ
jgi:ribosomal protein S15P/S13E